MTPPRRYEPPPGDEPLDAIEQAVARAMVAAILAEMGEEDAAAATSGAPTPTTNRTEPGARKRGPAYPQKDPAP